MTLAVLMVLGVVGAGTAGFLSGRFTGGQKPSDLWLLGAFALGVIFGGLIAKE